MTLARAGPSPGLMASISPDLIVLCSTCGPEPWAIPLWALLHADHRLALKDSGCLEPVPGGEH